MLNNNVICFVSAKFLKLEQLDQEPSFPPDTAGVSLDGTGQVGTYFYTAPEIEQGWPKIDEKVNFLLYLFLLFFFNNLHNLECASCASALIACNLFLFKIISGKHH